VARELIARGHRVRLMSDRANRPEAIGAGIEFHAWQAGPSRADLTEVSCPLRVWEAASPQEGIWRLLARITFPAALNYAGDLAAAFDAEPADLVVTGEVLMSAHLGTLNHTRAALDLAPRDSVLKQLDVAALYVLASSRAFDFPVANLTEQIRYIGPQLDEPEWVELRL